MGERPRGVTRKISSRTDPSGHGFDIAVFATIAGGELTFGAAAAGEGPVLLGVAVNPFLAFLLLAVIFYLAIKMFQIEWNCARHGVSVADCGSAEGSATGVGFLDILFATAHIDGVVNAVNTCKVKVKPGGAKQIFDFAVQCPGSPNSTGQDDDCVAKGVADAAQGVVGDALTGGGDPAGIIAGLPGDVASGIGGSIACSTGIPSCSGTSAPSPVNGGVYALLNDEGTVVYVGRTNDLARRQMEHSRDSIMGALNFQILYKTDDYATMRGLEQIEYERYHPALNKSRPISPSNPNGRNYLTAARDFLDCIGG